MGIYAEPRNVTSLSECRFYHTLDLPGYGVVRGDWDLRDNFDEYVGHVELRGKRVLDVGTASGFLTFEAEKRGAEVVSYDMNDASILCTLPFRQNLFYQDRAEWVRQMTRAYEPMKNSYWLAHRALNSKAKVHYGILNNLPQELGRFDVVILGSITEHLSDQIAALASVSRLATDIIVVNSPVIMVEDKIAEFLPSANRPDDDYTWWIYSLGVYREIFAMLGYAITNVVHTNCMRVGTGNQLRTTLVMKRESEGSPAKTISEVGKNVFVRLNELEMELSTTKAKLAQFETVGQSALEVTRLWRQVSSRYPRTSSFAKPVLKRFLMSKNTAQSSLSLNQASSKN
jgi:hypothetical protein